MTGRLNNEQARLHSLLGLNHETLHFILFDIDEPLASSQLDTFNPIIESHLGWEQPERSGLI